MHHFLSHFDVASPFFLKCVHVLHRMSAALQCYCVCCHLIFNILPLVTPEINELLTFHFCILRTILCTLHILSPENLLNDHMSTIMHSTERITMINIACKRIYFFSNQCLHSNVVTFNFSCIMNLM